MQTESLHDTCYLHRAQRGGGQHAVCLTQCLLVNHTVIFHKSSPCWKTSGRTVCCWSPESVFHHWNKMEISFPTNSDKTILATALEICPLFLFNSHIVWRILLQQHSLKTHFCCKWLHFFFFLFAVTHRDRDVNTVHTVHTVPRAIHSRATGRRRIGFCSSITSSNASHTFMTRLWDDAAANKSRWGHSVFNSIISCVLKAAATS